jgi:hypothetical protein
MNKLKLFALFISLIYLFFLGACAAQPSLNNQASNSAGGSYSDPARSEAARSNNSPGSASSSGGGGDKSAANPAAAPHDSSVSLDQADKSQPQPAQRKIIRNAELTIEASSPEEAQKKISSITESKGGFVVESQQSSTNIQATTHDRVTMTIRVPADKFDETLDEIRKADGRVIVETVKGQDVTEEFIDVEARLKTKKELEARFLEILKQAKTVQETLDVQTQLTNVRTEIEQIEGRKRFLESQTSLSTIKLTLQTPTVFSANSSGFVYQLGRSIGAGFEAAMGFVLVFITFIIAIIPFLVLVVLPIYLLVRYFWRKYKKRWLANKLSQEDKAAEKAAEKPAGIPVEKT